MSLFAWIILIAVIFAVLAVLDVAIAVAALRDVDSGG